MVQETLNYWKQLSHVMKYFRKEEDPNASLPKNFMQGFLEVCIVHYPRKTESNDYLGTKLEDTDQPSSASCT